MMSLLLFFFISSTLALDAVVKSQCDDSGVLTRSDDGGATFPITLTTNGGRWTQLMTAVVSGITPQTVIRMRCTDTGSVIAGFIAQVDIAGELYLTTNPISAGNWERTAISSTTDSSYVYTLRDGSRTWGTYWPSEEISASAYWIWNGQASGWQIFEFDFGKIWCEITGNNLLSKPHKCSCQPACTGAYCNSLDDVSKRLAGTASATCPNSEECCCSCPNCTPYLS